MITCTDPRHAPPTQRSLRNRRSMVRPASRAPPKFRRSNRGAPMHQRSLVAAFVSALSLVSIFISAAPSTGPVTIKVADDRIDIHAGGTLFTALHTAKAANKLYLHPVMTASGKRVTRAFPMEKVEGESTDH